MSQETAQIVIETIKESGITKNDALPLTGWSGTIYNAATNPEFISIAISVVVGLAIICHKVIQIKILMGEHKLNMQKLEQNKND